MQHVKGIRRTVKIYGQVQDPKTARRLEREKKLGPIRRPHAELQVSVKPTIKGALQ